MENILRNAIAAAVLGLNAVAAHSANVLVVLSDESQLALRDNRTFDTGFYANELMQPVKRLLDAGHTVTFATPLGKAPTVDRGSIDKMYFGNDEAAMRQHLALLDKLQLTSAAHSPVISLARVEQAGYDRYDAIYIPGGHAPMQDLLYSAPLGRVLAAFHQQGKPTALVCHGPIALLSTLDAPRQLTLPLESGGQAGRAPAWIYAGYRMTVISNNEEEAAKGMLKGGVMKFTPQTALESAGGVYSSGANWQSYVVKDRELITGQNPASANAVADELLARLKR
ncbi:type 1 glutamine amidotransferase domain-containing protein [Pseudoduganella sp. FT25W]|uniref:Type 1 glutamine amidotransferase domain-containing protein n=1 Tax=Duganella alba TaxID=2666081 RepID=A0A6L5QMN1_9BURK|nr:type 1 glutamine amidotransferase domain-containing protein [Duganella alba]MRX10512.1 type 1 glutamine amidotransferase domain-containing protein [Duganella alba]MRX18132.1 type 1 glutamine amidotransferase domain-containing protein [Duganella alba]